VSTAGEFGPDRVRDTPILEMAIVGIGVGAALLGLRPVVEIMYEDFLSHAADGIVNQAAKWGYMSGGQYRVPLVAAGNKGRSIRNRCTPGLPMSAACGWSCPPPSQTRVTC